MTSTVNRLIYNTYTVYIVYTTYNLKGDYMNDKQRAIEQARELIRSAWTDDLPMDIQKDLENIYNELKFIAEEL